MEGVVPWRQPTRQVTVTWQSPKRDRSAIRSEAGGRAPPSRPSWTSSSGSPPKDPRASRPPRSGWRCSTTMARCGARSRCPSSSTSSCAAWQAAYIRDYAWLGEVITKHYHGDDSELPVLAAGILQAFSGITVEDFEDR